VTAPVTVAGPFGRSLSVTVPVTGGQGVYGDQRMLQGWKEDLIGRRDYAGRRGGRHEK